MDKKHKGILVLLGLLGAVTQLHAQHEADTWYFGNQVGFSFRSGNPQVLLDGQMKASEACTVASDPATGQLQLYSNGAQVWGRDHRVLPTGSALWGNAPPNDATQGALLVPVPGDAASYYLFTLRAGTSVIGRAAAAYGSSLAYSQIDLRRNNGLGDVIPETKNRVLTSGLTEKLTAVRHTNGRDYWLLAHEWLSNAFVVYPVTAAGVGLPARYAIGPVQPSDTLQAFFQDEVYGGLQASPDSRHLAFGTLASAGTPPPFGLYDFDAATGVISNYVNLGRLQDAYGPCFSPDNTKLYVSNFSRTPDRQNYNIISQFDLQAGDAAAIAASGQSIIVGNPTTNISATVLGQSPYLLQNAPDGRIYGVPNYAGTNPQPGDGGNILFVISRPNTRGFGCQVHFQRFELGGRAASGLPNIMQHYFNGREPSPDSDVACDLSAVSLFPNPNTETFWVQLATICQRPRFVVLYDAVGRRVAQYGPGEATGQLPINMASLAAGLYMVELQFTQEVVRKKLMKY